jgi:hypothetical protein
MNTRNEFEVYRAATLTGIRCALFVTFAKPRMQM